MKRTHLWTGLAASIALFALTAYFAPLPARAQTSYAFRDLGTLRGTYSAAYTVNDLWHVVGRSTRTGQPTQYARAFYWSVATGMIDIGTLGGTYSYAFSIN